MTPEEAAGGESQSGSPREEASGRPEPPGLLLSFAHLAVLSAFALAQPLFDLLSDNPEFFAARGSSAFDIISFALLATLVPPLVLIAIEFLAGLASDRLRTVVHLVFIGGLAGLVLIQALKKAIDTSDFVLIAGAVLLGLAAAVLYARAEPVRSFLSVLSPAPLVFLALFLFTDPISKLTLTGEAEAKTVGNVSRAPIVVVLLDELPSISLMDSRRRVDERRFPGFAKLARDGTWFRNTYTVYDSTERAQPAIMDGNYPVKERLPTSSDHPNSIFTLFANSHRLNVSEEATSVCPRDLCRDERLDESYSSRMKSMGDDLAQVYLHVIAPPGIEKDLPTVSENWGNFGGDGGGGDTGGGDDGGNDQGAAARANLQGNRNKRFDAWIADIKGGRPALNFKHALLPHVPWQYLPDGRQYKRTAGDPVPGLSNQSYNSQGQLDSLYQRHLLQLGFTDLELRKLWRKLEREGIYDDALIVVAADHGVAFDLGERDRRKITEKNWDEIAPIPFFIKAPGQRRGRVDDAYVESTDILPTIFDVLNVDPRVKMDGSSAFGRRVQERDEVKIFERGTFKPIRIPAEKFERRKRAVLDEKVRLFGEGAEGPERIFRIGPNTELLGRSLQDVSVVGGGAVRAELVNAGEYRNVDLRSATVPIHVVGRVSGGGGERDLAIAVNGRIRAVSRSFKLATGGGELLAALVPPGSFRQGRNRVEVFEVRPSAAGPTLTKMGGN